MSRILNLSKFTPIASGGRRWIYEVPEYPGMIVKVNKTGKDAIKPKLRKRIMSAIFPKTADRALKIEVQSYIKFNFNNCDAILSILPRFHGFVQTDIGLGYLFEKISQPDGQLAPTLALLHYEGNFTQKHLEALNHLMSIISSQSVVVNDFHPRNIVYADDQCFVIDGLGDRNLIPLRSMSKAFDRYKFKKFIPKLEEELDLTWDKNDKKFISQSELN